MELLAPAKINLRLAVKRRREDGYHEIETLICPISLFDRLDVEVHPEERFEFLCDDPSLPATSDNLVYRAAHLFCTEVGIEPHLRISLHKTIPHGAGLGGGSSNAASTLLALNAIFETDLPRQTLLSLAAELGSDVSLFLLQSAALCEGRGERVTPVAFRDRLPLLLVKPPFGVPTPWAYQRWNGSLEIPGAPYNAQRFAWGTLANDLERPVFEKYLFLALLKRWLLEQPEVAGALLSGSGSALFAVLREPAAAAGLAGRIQEELGANLWMAPCETLGHLAGISTH